MHFGRSREGPARSTAASRQSTRLPYTEARLGPPWSPSWPGCGFHLGSGLAGLRTR